jgi:hypothetical protein
MTECVKLLWRQYAKVSKIEASRASPELPCKEKVISDSYLSSPSKKSELSGSIHVNFFTTSALFKLQFLA